MVVSCDKYFALRHFHTPLCPFGPKYVYVLRDKPTHMNCSVFPLFVEHSFSAEIQKQLQIYAMLLLNALGLWCGNVAFHMVRIPLFSNQYIYDMCEPMRSCLHITICMFNFNTFCQKKCLSEDVNPLNRSLISRIINLHNRRERYLCLPKKYIINNLIHNLIHNLLFFLPIIHNLLVSLH